MGLTYNYSGRREDLIQMLRHYRLDELLRYISSYASELIKHRQPNEVYGVRVESYIVQNAATRNYEEMDVFVTAWDLVDLAYEAILATNDYRAGLIDKDEFLMLCSGIRATGEIREKERLDNPNWTHKDMMLYLFGFGTEQFRYETLNIHNAAIHRELYMLLELAPKIQGVSDIPVIIKSEIGVEWKTVLGSLSLAWVASLMNISQEQVLAHTLWNESFKKEDYEKVLSYYTTTYTEVRENKREKRQLFYIKPFIRTERTNSLICVSPYLAFFLYEHCLFWLVRNYYSKQKNQLFTSEFGKIFEVYFYNLLTNTVGYENFQKIIEESEERADWYVEIGGYRFLIEQKSAALGLMAKQQDSDIKETETYCKRNIIKALKQLEKTEQVLNDGPYIKLILIYEEYLNTHILDTVFQMEECKTIDDCLYWIITIEEAEMLFHLYKENSPLFSCIVEEKAMLEKTKSKEGRSFLLLLKRHGIKINAYLARSEISKYDLYGFKEVFNILPEQ